jgi:hypothetical protein
MEAGDIKLSIHAVNINTQFERILQCGSYHVWAIQYDGLKYWVVTMILDTGDYFRLIVMKLMRTFNCVTVTFELPTLQHFRLQFPVSDYDAADKQRNNTGDQ